MNVVAWARVSSEDQEKGYSVDAQLRALEDKAQKAGYVIVERFTVTESAKHGINRNKFNAMLEWVKANAKRMKLGAILSHKLDRVCRNMRDAVRLQELEAQHGVKLAFVENQFGPGPSGMLSFNVMAAVAQYYSDNLRTEVLKGMNERVRQGWFAWHAPFGYLNSPDKSEPIKVHPERSKAVLRIFELYRTGAWTFKALGRQLAEEGFTYQPSQPAFNRRALSQILNNRFYIGELHTRGGVYQGKHKLFVERNAFNECQAVLKGKNRRIGSPQLAFSGGLFRCAYCGFAVTGELIRKKLKDGSVNLHAYYRCANNHKPPDHPPLRWREVDLENAVIADLESLKGPSRKSAEVFKDVVKAAFANLGESQKFRRQQLQKRLSELSGMQDRLMNGYLLGAIAENAFQTKSASLKTEKEEVEKALSESSRFDPAYAETALDVLDFGQQAADLWRGSNSSVRRKLLESVSLNRVLTEVSLVTEKRKPFDWMAKNSIMKYGVPTRIRTWITGFGGRYSIH